MKTVSVVMYADHDGELDRKVVPSPKRGAKGSITSTNWQRQIKETLFDMIDEVQVEEGDRFVIEVQP
jgi:CRISPR/Cas system type I-B associated protein Csh2 (Cas7 group RAMP superfamily)